MADEPEARDDLERPIISEREKPALDEVTFQQLLEAAHVLQGQKGPEVSSRPKMDPEEALSEILETQEFLRTQPADLQIAASVVVERLQRITHATGVAIAVVQENRLQYCAATGDAARLAGTSLPMDSSLSAEGELSTEFSRGFPDQHAIALPLHHEGNLTGLLEIRFSDAASIAAPDIRSCQLMAGLMTEAIARAADKAWKQTLAAERAAMLEALERIKPQLERLAVEPGKNIALPEEDAVEPADHVIESLEASAGPRIQETRIQEPAESSASANKDAACVHCGYQFGEQELFCGRCGTARPSRAVPSGDLQSKWASLWRIQQAAENRQHEEGENNGERTEINRATVQDSHLSRDTSAQENAPQFSDPLHVPAPEDDSRAVGDETTIPISPTLREGSKQPSPWASASQTHRWLQSLHSQSPAGIWLTKHRGDIYVGAAVLVLLIVLSGRGMHPAENHVPGKTSQPRLTLFERVLVGLGLAEPPPAPVYLGNPNAQVWVDLHTALYYCSDSDLYGKTAGGKFTSQRDAQMDQFEPAARRNCD